MDNPTRARLEADQQGLERLEADNQGLLKVQRMIGSPPQLYEIEFCASVFVRAGEAVVPQQGCIVALALPGGYPWEAPQCRVIAPADLFHPNVAKDLNLVCFGGHLPDAPLALLVANLYRIITFRNCSMAEEALNREAAVWARSMPPGTFPSEPRSLDEKSIFAMATA